MKKYFIYLFILASVSVFAQSKYNVEFNEIKGELSKTDKFKPDFGKYDGFQIPLAAGEKINVNLLTNQFSGKLLLVNPKGEIFKLGQSNNGIANINAIVPSDGEWIIYVVGDSKSFGNYLVQYSLADLNSQKFPLDTDFCSALLFIAEHSNANFMLMEDNSKTNARFPRLFGSIDNYIEEDEPVFNSVFYSGNNLNEAKDIFTKLNGDVEICLGNDFKKNSIKKGKGEVEKFNFLSKKKDDTKEISLVIMDNKESAGIEMDRFQVVIKIYKRL